MLMAVDMQGATLWGRHDLDPWRCPARSRPCCSRVRGRLTDCFDRLDVWCRAYGPVGTTQHRQIGEMGNRRDSRCPAERRTARTSAVSRQPQIGCKGLCCELDVIRHAQEFRRDPGAGRIPGRASRTRPLTAAPGSRPRSPCHAVTRDQQSADRCVNRLRATVQRVVGELRSSPALRHRPGAARRAWPALGCGAGAPGIAVRSW